MEGAWVAAESRKESLRRLAVESSYSELAVVHSWVAVFEDKSTSLTEAICGISGRGMSIYLM